MATSFTLLTLNANDPTTLKASENHEAKPAAAMELVKTENEAKPAAAMEPVKSNRGRKPGEKGPYQKKQPRRGMGVAQLERLMTMEEEYKMMTGTALTAATATATTTTTTPFPSIPVGTSCSVPVLHGVASYGVPVMIDGGGGGNGGLCSWGHPSGLVMQRVAAGNGTGFVGGLVSGQVLVGAPARSFHQGVVVEASKELSSMPKLQHCNPDHCHVCFKKKRSNGENARFIGGFNQLGQVLPVKGTDFLGVKKLERKENFNGELINGLTGTARAARRSAASYGGQMNINETVDVVAIHKKESSMGTGSSTVLMEYEFFPGKSSRSTPTKKWEMPSVAVGGEASHANASNCVDLYLKLSF